MRIQFGTLTIALSIMMASVAFEASASVADVAETLAKTPVGQDQGMLIAKDTKDSKGGKSRERRLSTEREVRTSPGGASTTIDFDSIDIGGERKTPVGAMVNQTKSDMDYDFVKIRMRWHPEMIQSAASLESGSTSK